MATLCVCVPCININASFLCVSLFFDCRANCVHLWFLFLIFIGVERESEREMFLLLLFWLRAMDSVSKWRPRTEKTKKNWRALCQRRGYSGLVRYTFSWGTGWWRWADTTRASRKRVAVRLGRVKRGR